MQEEFFQPGALVPLTPALSLSTKHLDRYVSESSWRYNRRSMGEGDRVNALVTDATGRLTYKDLIA
jgi:hypothetical protein